MWRVPLVILSMIDEAAMTGAMRAELRRPAAETIGAVAQRR